MSQTARSTDKLTYDDLMAMFPEDDGVRREIIGGELFEMTSPLVQHQRLVARLTLSLGAHLETHPEQGEVFVAPLDVVLTPHDVVEPDLLIVLADQRDIVTKMHIQGTPGIVIEVLSPSTRQRDQTVKKQLFDRQGVREYWLVDPDRNSAAVHRRGHDGSFPLTTTLHSSDTLMTPLLPGWSLSLEKLFR